VPQVPPTHAIPPPHWLFAVQLVQVPLMHASPPGPVGGPMTVLHSANVVHAPHTLLTQAWPFRHEFGPPCEHPATKFVVQIPVWQVSPDWQSPSAVQVHSMPEWVAVHAAVALDPHWLFVVHATHASFTQT
jgi:hypothetical protein